jgi:hypothetical protein
MAIRITALDEAGGEGDLTVEVNSGQELGDGLQLIREWIADGDRGQIIVTDTLTGAVLADVSVVSGQTADAFTAAWEGARDVIREEVEQHFGIQPKRGGVRITP